MADHEPLPKESIAFASNITHEPTDKKGGFRGIARFVALHAGI